MYRWITTQNDVQLEENAKGLDRAWTADEQKRQRKKKLIASNYLFLSCQGGGLDV